MSKIKVYEIAKEYEQSNKDVIHLLQEKGFDVKSHSNALEEDAEQFLRKHFVKGKNEDDAKKVKKVEKVSVRDIKEEIKTTNQEAPVKKKKNIIFVSNPQNSKMPNQTRPAFGNDKTPVNGQNREVAGTSLRRPQTAPVQSTAPVVSPMDKISQEVKKDTSSTVQTVAPAAAPTVAAPVSAPASAAVPTSASASASAPTSAAPTASASAPTSTSTPAQRPQGVRTEGNAGTGNDNRSSYQGRPSGTGNDNRSSYQGRPSGTGNDNRSSYQGRPSGTGNDNRSSYQGRPAGTGNDNRSSYQGRPSGTGNDNRSSYQGRPAGAGNDNKSSYQGRPAGAGSDNRSSYQGRPSGTGNDNRSSYQGRPSGTGNDNRSSYQGRPSGTGTDSRPPYQGRPAGQGTGGGYSGGYNRNNGDASRPYNSTARPNTGGGANTGGRSNEFRKPDDRNRGNYSQGDKNRPGGSFGGTANRPYGNNDRPNKVDERENGRFAKKPQAGKAMGEQEKRREEEKRRLSQEKDKRSKRELVYEEEKNKLKNKPGRFIKPEKKIEEKIEEQIKVITVSEILTIKELADKMKIQPSAIVKKLFLTGEIVTVNQEISYEKAEEIAIEYDIICEQEVKVDLIEELLKEEDEDVANMTTRPPVICVMGHVDHGKTSLLDAIRKTNVTDREAGGITQHIGAYTVKVKNQTITFLDTPGHEAFTSMRMRGANATDIAILVVAADDGVMPQTVEAINHAKAAGIEIIVAVNKIDKPNANLDRVKQELTEHTLIAEDWGGSTVFAPVSAKTGEGIEQLLEMILLTSEILELKADSKRRARGLVIEAELDKGRGPVATVLVQKGTLQVGDFIAAGSCHGKVRAMIDDKGRRVKEAGPSTPVEILGLNDVPNAGDIFVAPENDKEAKNFADTFISQNRVRMLDDTKAKMSLDDLFTQIQAGNLKELNLIVKADVQGSVEAVKQSLLKLSNEEVIAKIIHSGVGAINESDVILASASNAIIIGFNVRPDVTAKTTAEREGVDVKLYKVIYQAIEDIQAAMKGMLDPIFEEKVLGHAEVRQIFRASALGNIAGSYVLDGIFIRGCKVRVSREGKQIFEGELGSLKRFKDDVKEVKTGFECGLIFDGFDQMQELDIVEAYTMVEVPR